MDREAHRTGREPFLLARERLRISPERCRMLRGRGRIPQAEVRLRREALRAADLSSPRLSLRGGGPSIGGKPGRKEERKS